MQKINFLISILFLQFSVSAQILKDDFEGNSTINQWSGSDCQVDVPFNNIFKNPDNPSDNVLKYSDNGGQFANVYFDSPTNILIGNDTPFSLKIYVPSNGITGNQTNQISLKLQNKNINEPWSTQCEVIKPIALNTWQTVTFDFVNDPYVNLNAGSPAPSLRSDFNRVVLQVNGENNNDRVLAYFDDFYFEGFVPIQPEFPVYDDLVWSDEFDGNGTIDTSKWFHQTLSPNGQSWFNGEIQHYTDRIENTFLQNGALHLVAKKENFTDQDVTKNYTSARLNSKFAFTYGRVDVRAKLPTGVGTWPAIWMLGKNISENGGYFDINGFGTTPWPACGEIDIMEHWGDNQNFVQSAMHTPSSFGATVNHGGQIIPTASTDFHVYTLLWYPDRMVFSVDSVVHYTYLPPVRNESTWPFEADQYILLNTAIQQSIDPSFTESTMEIDYVRVYQESIPSSTQEIVNSGLKLYPNPTNGILNVKSDIIGLSEISIYDVYGKLISKFSFNTPQYQLDISHLSSGIYLIQQSGNHETFIQKIIKQ